MKTSMILLNFVFAIPILLNAQNAPSPELIRDTQRSVCAVKIVSKTSSGGMTASVGCGVVLMSRVDEKKTYFIATASHIVERLFSDEQASAEILVFDNSGMMYKTSGIKREHVLWRNRELDAALLLLPEDLKMEGDPPAGYSFNGLSNLKMIGQPAWGEEIYLFGYRWLTGDHFIDILKKGILSVGTTRLPGYEGHLVFLIDNMANKGMSGGLAFTAEGKGIGIISSYVYEVDSSLQNSDDLTVCLPLSFFYKALEEVITTDKEKIMRLKGN